MQKILLAAATALFLLLQGCATLVGDETQVVPISSTPAGATIRVSDESGRVVYRGMTPASLAMKKSTGQYWGGKRYHITLAKSGYATQTFALTTSPNAWYLAGNFLVSGGIGWFVVDPFSGKMYSLSPEGIDAHLGRLLGAASPPPVPVAAPPAATPAALPTPVPSSPAPVAVPAAAPAAPQPVVVPLAPAPDVPETTPNPAAAPAAGPTVVDAPVKEVPKDAAADKRKKDVEKSIDAAPDGDFGATEAVRRYLGSPSDPAADPAAAPAADPASQATRPAAPAPEPASAPTAASAGSADPAPAAAPLSASPPARPPAPPPASANPW
jgi:hypothetical protein